MKTLTVFTPTFNRAYTLHKCYESLVRQTSKNFKWLIIDDGSTDNTKELVDKWIKEDKIEIEYFFQENQGMSGAHNTAYRLINTELNTCIDSDDYMTDNAVESILKYWKIHGSNKVAGIAALDIYENGDVIGTKFPVGINTSKYIDIYNFLGVKGDKKFIYRTELTKMFPYPIFKNEKYVSLAYKYMKLDDEAPLLLMNSPVCVVEYMYDGSSRNMIKQYRRNPKGFAFIRLENLKLKNQSRMFYFKQYIHYISSCKLSKDKHFLSKVPNKFEGVLAYPLGLLLYIMIMCKTRNLKVQEEAK